MHHYLPLPISYILFGLIIAICCTLLNAWLLRRLAHIGTNHNAKNQTDWVRWAATPKPAIGGIGFFAAFCLVLIAYFCLIQLNLSAIPDSRSMAALVLAVTLGFLVGLVDDAYQMRPLFKFGGQLICALLLIAGGIIIDISDVWLINALLTILWVTGMMNSINMLDNMDGITASVSFFVLLNIILSMTLDTSISTFHSILLTGSMGSLLGFLYYNWHPSRMFMGDSGSQFLGVLLSALSIIYLWQRGNSGQETANLQQFLLPMLVFLLPLIDTTTVTIRRLARGQSPFVGGRDHTTHHLGYCGLRDNQVAYVFVTLSIINTIIAYYVCHHWSVWNTNYTITLIGYIVVVFIAFQGCYEYGKFKKST